MSKKRTPRKRAFVVERDFATSKQEYKKGDIMYLSCDITINYLINEQLISEKL
jgi:hypothetical protein